MEYYKFHDSKNIENTKNLVIMQNTGYKDAKNKDIFEGDIVYLFGINNGQMNIMVIGDIKKIPDEIVYRSPHLMEAMGDVYQNQDLIHSHFRCLKNDEVNIRWANKCGKIGRQNADLRVEKLKLTKDRLISELKKLDPELSKQALVSYNQIFCEKCCLLYTSPSPRDRQKSRMPSSA